LKITGKGGGDMKRKWIPLVILLTFLMMPGLALGAKHYDGSIQGFLCITTGVTCPIGKEDLVADAENVFVLYRCPGVWHFISNVDRKLLARGINKTVLVSGMLDEQTNSIMAEKIRIKTDEGKWREVWSADLMDEFYSDILGAHPLKRGQ
jgi:hypothetical protein